jgi:hypothetical protein
MALLLSNLPHIAFAESHMISTSQVADELSRTEAQQQIESYLEKPELRKALIARGISPDEVSYRLASLSDSELRQMATEMNRAQYGGDILLAILVIVLIIFLIKRI